MGFQSQLHNARSQYASELKMSEIMWIYTYCSKILMLPDNETVLWTPCYCIYNTYPFIPYHPPLPPPTHAHARMSSKWIKELIFNVK